MRIAMICALGAWLALVVLQEALAARERSRLQRQAEAQERMWRNARDMQMLEELAKQIVTGQDAGTTNEAGTL